MSQLDRLIAAERDAMVPSESSRAASLAGLQRAIADGRTPIVEAPHAGAPLLASGRGWVKPTVIAALVLSLGGVALMLAPRPYDVPSEEPPAAVDVEPPVERPTPLVPTPPTTVVPDVTPAIVPAVPSVRASEPRPQKRRASPAAERDDFAAELGLLKRAKTSHVAGDRAGALAILREQARLFPRGAFVEERRALEAITLCELGRVDRGRAAAAAFERDFAASPQTERVRRACD